MIPGGIFLFTAKIAKDAKIFSGIPRTNLRDLRG